MLRGPPTSAADASARAAELRASVARAVMDDPSTWSEAVLGRPGAEYAAYISRMETWGGGLELSILCSLHRVEIVANEIRSGVAYKFGEGSGFPLVMFLIYDGLHYDALVSGEGREADERLLPAAEPRWRGAALAVAAAACAAHQFTDVAGFSLRCGGCGLGVVGQVEAVEHAKATGHANFLEFKP